MNDKTPTREQELLAAAERFVKAQGDTAAAAKTHERANAAEALCHEAEAAAHTALLDFVGNNIRTQHVLLDDGRLLTVHNDGRVDVAAVVKKSSKA